MIFIRKTKSKPYQSCTFSLLITGVSITYGQYFFLKIVTICFLNQIVLHITVPKTNMFVCVLNINVEIFDFKVPPADKFRIDDMVTRLQYLLNIKTINMFKPAKLKTARFFF